MEKVDCRVGTYFESRLAMAQALVGFPSMSKGASLMDYVLTFEKLVGQYERLSGTKYDENLQIGTLLKGLPQELRRHILVDITDRTTYSELRMKLWYEGSNQTRSAENILGSLSVQNTSSTHSKEYQGPTPMEIDRLHKGGPKGSGKKGDKGGNGKNGGKGKGQRIRWTRKRLRQRKI